MLRKYRLPFYLVILLLVFTSCSADELKEVDYSFKVAISPHSRIDITDEVTFEAFDNLNLGFFKGSILLELKIKNSDESKSLMFVNDDLFNRNYEFYKLDTLDGRFELIPSNNHLLGSDFRTFNHVNPNLKIELRPNQQATYRIAMSSDGRTVNATPRLISENQYISETNQNEIWSVVFLGTIFFLLLLNLYLGSIHKQKIYIYYIFYMLATLFMYVGFEGHLYKLGITNLSVDHIIFVAVRLWELTLIIFTAKFLESERENPQFYKVTIWLLALLLGGNTLYQFIFFTSSIEHLHYYENILSFLWLLLILVMILLSARDRRLEVRYYFIPLLVLLLFVIIGLIDGHFQWLPGSPFIYIKLGTILEFAGFTYFMTALIKRKLRQGENLQKELEKRSEELVSSAKKLEELDSLLKRKTSMEKTDLLSVFSLLENSLSKENDWEGFKQKFENLNPIFLKELIKKHPDLSKTEIRLLTLLRIGYAQKEIANMLNIAPASVKKATQRVRKKMDLSKEKKLREYLHEF